MRILSVIGQKGGTGKTTIAAAMAVNAAILGRSAAIIDLDPQCNAAKWSDRRSRLGKDDVPVVPCPVGRLDKAIEAARKDGVELLVIDTAPSSDSPAIAAAKVANFILLPFHPHLFDLDTLGNVKDLLLLAGKPLAAIVWNDAPTRGRRHFDAAEQFGDQGLPVCPIVIFDRVGHSDPSNIGLTAFECEPDGKAALEMRRLYAYTQINLQDWSSITL
jgi:chromosome partitioning protein